MTWTLPLLLACIAAALMAVALVALRRAVRSARQKEAWHRTMLDTAVDAVIAYDIDGRVLDCNPSAQRLFGMSREQLLASRMGALLPVGVDTSIALRRLASDHDEAGLTREAQAVRHDGRSISVRVATGHAESNGQHTFVAFISDISARKRIEQALRDSELQLRSLVGNVPGIAFRCATDKDLSHLFISDAVERFTGYPAADFLGTAPKRRLHDLIHPEDWLGAQLAIDDAIQARRPFSVEYRLRHRDGTVWWMWSNGSPVVGPDGNVAWIDGVMQDTTERRRMEIELRDAKEHAERSAEARAAFLANMSHEIRTPMNAILGFTDVLLLGSLTDAQRRHLDVVRNAGGSLLRLLDGVLDSAKLDRGAVELEQADFDFAALIDELVASHGVAARAKGLALGVSHGPEVPRHLHGDALRVRQVLTNLLSNAVKFTQAGRIEIVVAAQAPWLRISVCDTGIGIAPDRQMAIFEPFTQADASMSRRFGGTGLGTTISKQLVELMGGTLTLESTPDVGSRFHVTLPLTPAQGPQLETTGTARRTAASAVPPLPPLRLLIVDDVEQNLELLALQLEPGGHRLVRARHGREAVARASAERFDLILMDLQMPEIDGLQATARIRADEAVNGREPVPVIAVSASVQASDRQAAQTAGMAGFVSKPVEAGLLIDEIARVLGLTDGEARSPVSPSSARPEPMPAVLDVAGAMPRWLHRREVYDRELQRYVDGLEALQAGLLAAGSAGDQVRLRELAHRSRGAAAGFGLDRLAAALLRLEQADGNAELAPAFGQLAGALREARHACADYAASVATQAFTSSDTSASSNG